MPDSELPDYRTPSPDAGHEAIRKPLAEAIDNLSAVIADLDQTKVGVDDAYFLTDLLFGLIDTLLGEGAATLRALDAHRIRIDALHVRADTAIDGMDALQTAVADLTARLGSIGDTLPGPDFAG